MPTPRSSQVCKSFERHYVVGTLKDAKGRPDSHNAEDTAVVVV